MLHLVDVGACFARHPEHDLGVIAAALVVGDIGADAVQTTFARREGPTLGGVAQS